MPSTNTDTDLDIAWGDSGIPAPPDALPFLPEVAMLTVVVAAGATVLAGWVLWQGIRHYRSRER